MLEKKVKIAHIIEGFSGGTCTYMCSVLPALVRRGCEVTFIVSLDRHCPDASERLSGLRRSGVKVEIMPMVRKIGPLQDMRAFLHLARLLSRGQFDIVHTHCSKAGALGRIAACVTNHAATVHSPHCFAFLRCGRPRRRKAYLLFERLLGRLTTTLAAVGPAEAGVATRYGIVRPAQCVCVDNGVANGAGTCGEAPTTAGVAKPANATYVVATLCRLVDYKGVLRFLEAARLSTTSNCLFLVAGEGELREPAEAFVRNHALDTKVRFAGYVPDTEWVYRIADLVVLCSDAEAMPYVLLEAMRAQRPIVATAVAGNSDLIEHARTGYLVAPDPAQIASVVDELLQDPDRRRQLSLCAYECVRTRYTLDRQIEQLIGVYQRAVRKE